MMYFPKKFFNRAAGGGGGGGIADGCTAATTLEALKKLYVELGGEADEVKNCVTNVEALNVIAAKYGGEADASLNADAVMNIAAVAEQIGGGGDIEFGEIEVSKTNGFVLQVIGTLEIGEDVDGNKTVRAVDVTMQASEEGPRKFVVPISQGTAPNAAIRFEVGTGTINSITGISGASTPLTSNYIKYVQVRSGDKITVNIAS